MQSIQKSYKTDVLVIGMGASGARAALAAAEAGSKVLITNKGPAGRSGITLTAGGGIQAPFYPDDSPEQYYQDTVAYGYGLADRNLAWALARDSCDRIHDMERYGVRFRKDEQGAFLLSHFPGHTYPRNIGFHGGGIGMLGPLKNCCLKHPNISVLDDFLVTGLLTSAEGEVAGAVGWNLKAGTFELLQAGATIIATGGCQQLWSISDCPADSTGDGLALAYRVGARLVDMEMILFYPSVIVWPPAAQGAFVHYEFLARDRLDGDILDAAGVPVLPKDPVPVRDEAMRLMNQAILEGRGGPHGGLFWYVGASPKGEAYVSQQLDNQQYRYLSQQGINPVKDKIEVAPGAHYQLGGIHIDEHCQTTVKGLFCTPEAAGNYEGANRLSGSALGGTQVFGYLAGCSAHRWALSHRDLTPDRLSIEAETARVQRHLYNGTAVPETLQLKEKLQQMSQDAIGVIRCEKKLLHFMEEVDRLEETLEHYRVPEKVAFQQPLMDLLELHAMVEVARLVAGSARTRTESRGHHYREDYPARDDVHWLKHTCVQRQEGQARFSTCEICMERRKD